MEPKFVLTPGTVQSTLLAALRGLAVLIGGFTAIIGFVGKRDLSGLIVYVQSTDFLPFAAALIAAGSFVWGVWKNYQRKHMLLTIEPFVRDSLMSVKRPAPKTKSPPALSILPVLLLVGLAVGLSGCATTDSVRLNASKAFYTGQVALRAAQQTTLNTCTTPPARLVDPCQRAIALLDKGAKAEAVGFTAQQAGNSAGLANALVVLIALPSQLAELGILEAR